LFCLSCSRPEPRNGKRPDLTLIESTNQGNWLENALFVEVVDGERCDQINTRSEEAEQAIFPIGTKPLAQPVVLL
jgi:hypothetical protein